MVSIVGHRIDYNGVGVLRGQRHIPSKTWPKYPPPGIILLLELSLLFFSSVSYIVNVNVALKVKANVSVNASDIRDF